MFGPLLTLIKVIKTVTVELYYVNANAPNIKISQYHEMQKEYEDHLEEEERARRILQVRLANT